MSFSTSNVLASCALATPTSAFQADASFTRQSAACLANAALSLSTPVMGESTSLELRVPTKLEIFRLKNSLDLQEIHLERMKFLDKNFLVPMQKLLTEDPKSAEYVQLASDILGIYNLSQEEEDLQTEFFQFIRTERRLIKIPPANPQKLAELRRQIANQKSEISVKILEMQRQIVEKEQRLCAWRLEAETRACEGIRLERQRQAFLLPLETRARVVVEQASKIDALRASWKCLKKDTKAKEALFMGVKKWLLESSKTSFERSKKQLALDLRIQNSWSCLYTARLKEARLKTASNVQNTRLSWWGSSLVHWVITANVRRDLLVVTWICQNEEKSICQALEAQLECELEETDQMFEYFQKMRSCECL